MQENIKSISQQLKEESIRMLENNKEENTSSNKKERLIFFVKQGLDSFIDDIIEGLSGEYEIKKIISTEYRHIDEGMQWADICWFEWCDELVLYGSKIELAYEKKIICRLHSYEAFTNYIYDVNWDNIDKVIFVAEHVKDNVLRKVGIDKNKAEVIYNGINLEKFKYKERKRGFNIAYVGYINFKKGPMLLLHTFKAIFDKDSRYKLYIAGQFQEERYVLYFQQMIKEMGLQNNIIYDGWQEDINKWLEDKNYILCTSVLEGNPLGVMEGMARGLRPIIHNFVGAKLQFGKYIWNTIDEAVNMIISEDYNSKEYREYINNKYSLEKQITSIKNVIKVIKKKDNIIIVVKKFLNNEKQNEVNLSQCTLLITLFNRAKILSDDLSRGFKFGLQDKIIINDYSTKDMEELNIIIKNREDLGVKNIITHENNKGLAGSRHTGFKNIKTLNTIVLDDDDLLLCIDKIGIEKDYNRLMEDSIIVIPRYIVNLYENGQIKICYDRKPYSELKAENVLKDISITSEIQAFLAGSISNTSELLKYNPKEIFIVAEDIMTIIRLLANNLDKKVVVSENYVHVRRINSGTLSKEINEKKLALGLISQCVGCFYCISKDIFKIESAFDYMRERGELIQQIYNYGKNFVEEIISYLIDEIQEEIFVKYLNGLDIKVETSIDEICLEINLMKKYVGSIKNNNK